MRSAHSAAAVRAAEQPLLEAGLGPALMRTASHGLAMGVATKLRGRGGTYGARVVLLVGPGNNGGDALFAGAWLASRGTRTTALLTGSRTHPQALAAFVKAGGRCQALAAFEEAGGRCQALEAGPAQARESAGVAVPQQVARFMAEARSSDVVIDGLLGTGGKGGLRGPVAGIVAELEAIRGPRRPIVVACDLPSGVDATTGEVHGPVLRADLTVTFGAYKTGLLSGPGEQLCGEVRLIDLGISGYLDNPDVHRLELAEIAALLPRPERHDQKYTRGVAGVIAGSEQYPGAGILAAAAASACGPGMVRYLGPHAARAALHVRNPEIVCSEDAPMDVKVQSWVVGPGIDGDDAQLQRAQAAIASGVPTVVDAGALALVAPAGGTMRGSAQDGPAAQENDARTPATNASLILTPHAGELAALMGRHGVEMDRAEIEASPLAAARAAADLMGTVVLLKGATTVVAAPSGPTYTQSNGTARLATAGSGDTLAGILGALLAMENAKSQATAGHLNAGDLARTAALAAALHGELSNDENGGPLNAGQLAQRISTVWARLCQINSGPDTVHHQRRR